MKITKEYLRSLIVESLEEVHDVKFMAGYPGYSKGDKGEYVPHAGPVPKFTDTIHSIRNVAAELKIFTRNIIKHYINDEKTKDETLQKLDQHIEHLEEIAKYLGDAQSKNAGYPDEVN